MKSLRNDGALAIRERVVGAHHHLTREVPGLEYARRLDTRPGRADLWYREHKDGLMWLLITVFVSFVTTVVTNWFLRE